MYDTKEDFMKAMILGRVAGITFLTTLAYLLTSCSATFMVAADDVYGTVPSRAEEYRYLQQQREKEVAQSDDISQSGEEMGYEGDEESQDFDYDDYYDYEYSSRLRRFHSDEYLSSDYYSDYYTNVYWYTYDPFYYGTSIYLGYNWWYPSYSYYRPGWYMGWRYDYFSFSFGWGGYYGWYRPSYGWGYHNGYWNGYWDGYWDSHWHDCHYDYCYNPYDRNTYSQSYYGRRVSGSQVSSPTVVRREASVGSVDGMASTGTGTSVGQVQPIRRTNSFAERYENSLVSSSAPSKVSTTGGSGSGRRVSTTVKPSSVMELSSNRISSTTSSVRVPVSGSSSVSGNSSGSSFRRVSGTTVSGNSNSSLQMNSSQSGSSRQEINRTGAVQPVRVSGASTVNRSVNTNVGNQSTRRPTSVSPTQSSSYRRTSGSTRTNSVSAPRQYNAPVYNRSSSGSSYVSPRYSTPANRSTVERSARSSYSSPRTSMTQRQTTVNSNRSSYTSGRVSSPSRVTTTSSSTGNSSGSVTRRVAR